MDDFIVDTNSDPTEAEGAPIWYWVLMTLIASISFWVQATVTEERFVPALNVIANEYNIPNDIAGATLMAAGASSPELFSSFVALFITHSALGLGTVSDVSLTVTNMAACDISQFILFAFLCLSIHSDCRVGDFQSAHYLCWSRFCMYVFNLSLRKAVPIQHLKSFLGTIYSISCNKFLLQLEAGSYSLIKP